jgi:glycosyltransferase involved in cell wall biosynthesis
VYAGYQNLAKRYPPHIAQLERRTLRRADGWIAFGHTVQDTLAPRPGYRDRPHVVIPPGVDLARFRPDPSAGQALRRELGWAEAGPPVVGYLGRFVPEKGLRVLQAAWQAASPSRLLLAGGGPLEGELRAWAGQQGDRVRVVTGVAHDQVPRHLAAMDLLAAPSLTTRRWREQFGRMLVEAMACGLPLIGSDSGEIPYVVGDAGLIAREGEVARWREALDQLITRAARRAELGARGLARARAEFALPGVAARHLQFFRELRQHSRAEGAR